MSRILVTGGSGFVGGHLVKRLLDDGHKVGCISRRAVPHLKKMGAKVHKSDLAKGVRPAALTSGYDAVFHLASVVSVDEFMKSPKESYMNNVGSTLNILEDVRLNNQACTIIYASSDRVYGNPKKDVVSEEDACAPVDPYGNSKLASELLITSYNKAYGTKYVVFRAGNIYGASQSPKLFIPSVITRMVSGVDEIRVGNLDTHRNFIYVKDVVDAYAKGLGKSGAQNSTYNISETNTSMQEVLDKLLALGEELLGKRFKVVQDKKRRRPRGSEQRTFLLDNTKAKKVLGWKPKYRFDAALRETFESYMDGAEYGKK